MFETSEEIAQNKLILLYLLKNINIAMTNSEICQFALEKRIMDYFAVQSCMEELFETSLLEKYRENDLTWYKTTEDGDRILSLFEEKIPKWMRKDALEYIENNGDRLRTEYEVNASVEKRGSEDYFVSCRIYGESRNIVMDIGVSVPDENIAEEIRDNWKKNSNDIYLKILGVFTENDKT